MYQRGDGHDPQSTDSDGYMETAPAPGISGDFEIGPISLGSYTTRWYEVFARFSVCLPLLRSFRFGSSEQWVFDNENRRDDGSPGMASMPWEAEQDIENEMFEMRYVVWNDWEQEYVAKWADSEEVSDARAKASGRLGFDSSGAFEDYPACEDEDGAALRALLGKLGMSTAVRLSGVRQGRGRDGRRRMTRR